MANVLDLSVAVQVQKQLVTGLNFESASDSDPSQLPGCEVRTAKLGSASGVLKGTCFVRRVTQLHEEDCGRVSEERRKAAVWMEAETAARSGWARVRAGVGSGRWWVW